MDDFKHESPNLEKLKAVFVELEFRSMWERVSGETKPKPQMVQGSLFDVATEPAIQSIGNLKTIDEVKHTYYLIDNDMSLLSLTAELSIQPAFCFDTETTGLDVKVAELVGISFSWKAHEAWYVPIPVDREAAKSLMNRFKRVLEDPRIEKIGQNLKYDALILKNYGIELSGPVFDTMVAHHLIQPGLKHNMNYLAETYLGYSPVSIEDLIGAKGKGQGNMRDVPIAQIKEYAAEDADVTWQLKQILEKELKKEGIDSFFREVEMPLLLVLLEMEQEGVKIDVDELKHFAGELTNRLINLEKNIVDMAGMDFNINSPKQVGEVLFQRLKVDDKAGKTKSGQFSTNEDVLQKIKDNHPIIPLILEHRGLKKLLTTYVEALPQLVVKETNRLHTSYNQSIVVTGRLSSSNPNLQNIPIRDEDGREIRKAFVAAGDEYLFLSADYSQVELRLMAHFSEDVHMLEAFNMGEDIHAATAARIYKIPLEEVTSDMRRKAKTANFGIIYGISAFGLAERLNIARSEAKGLIDGYFDNFPGVKTYMEQCISLARDKGYVETLFGRKRYLPDINSRNAIVRGMAERNAINAPIQGTAADIIKKAMVDIQKRMKAENLKSKMILQVHDELNFDVFKPELDKVKALVKEAMESAVALKVPLLVDMGVGKNWLEAH